MQLIGLLMTYNEEFIIEEMMRANLPYFDKILVLDGSTDRTPEILKSFDNVVHYLHDSDIVPKRKITDGARQFLLEKAWEMYGHEGWFHLLHADEMVVDDPRVIAQRAEDQGAELVNWHNLNFFLHSSQSPEDYDFNKSVQEQVVFYQPGGLEVRQFKNKPGIFYDLNQVYRVRPHGLKDKTLWDFPIYKHYVTYRPDQFEAKPYKGLKIVRDEDEKIENKQFELNSAYKDKVEPRLKQVRKFEGDFGEFTPGKRPGFIRQYLAWHKYAPAW
jgi:glycosyltransferase involved in cell wall biosynthesis